MVRQMRSWNDDRQWWLASIVQHGPTVRIISKSGGDVAAKRKKIFVKEICIGPEQT